MTNVSKWISGKGVFFIAVFSLAVLIADQFRFAAIWGASDQYFTGFQFIGPIAGGILGVFGGVLSVLIAEIFSFLYVGRESSLINIVRLAPMLFGAYYFAKFGMNKGIRGNYALLAPIAAILLFITHPIGSQSWYFSLFWTIPVIAALFFKENLFARSLGATFTAHAIGGITWLYLVPTTPAFWASLIPVVMYERMVFAAGISLSFIAFNTLLSRAGSLVSSEFLMIDRRYALFGNPRPERVRIMRK
ncbi:MAG: hypothetical protein ABH863_05600 [Candidatus Micrarchaeota archaeon]